MCYVVYANEILKNEYWLAENLAHLVCNVNVESQMDLGMLRIIWENNILDIIVVKKFGPYVMQTF